MDNGHLDLQEVQHLLLYATDDVYKFEKLLVKALLWKVMFLTEHILPVLPFPTELPFYCTVLVVLIK